MAGIDLEETNSSLESGTYFRIFFYFIFSSVCFFLYLVLFLPLQSQIASETKEERVLQTVYLHNTCVFAQYVCLTAHCTNVEQIASLVSLIGVSVYAVGYLLIYLHSSVCVRVKVY